MDCVACDKCRLWGKVQTTGLGTALKILFELDEKALEYVFLFGIGIGSQFLNYTFQPAPKLQSLATFRSRCVDQYVASIQRKLRALCRFQRNVG